MIDARRLLGEGTHDLIFIVLDSLRFDVAEREMSAGRTPNLRALVGVWEKRHAPGTFTYASHAAFFAGFLPTPATPGRHERLFAMAFQGSETTGKQTLVLDAPDLPTGLLARGFHTACVGGVGFFNLETPLGRVLPSLFAERHWRPELGVTDPRSSEHQLRLCAQIVDEQPRDRRLFLFVNISALHQPNRHYLTGATEDSVDTQAAALRYVDSQLPVLLEALARRGPSVILIGSDHGTCYGEDGFRGHRLAHPAVFDVPWAEVVR